MMIIINLLLIAITTSNQNTGQKLIAVNEKLYFIGVYMYMLHIYMHNIIYGGIIYPPKQKLVQN